MERKQGSQRGKTNLQFCNRQRQQFEAPNQKLSLTTTNFKLYVCMHGMGPANWNQRPLEKEHTAGYHSRSCEIIVC